MNHYKVPEKRIFLSSISDFNSKNQYCVISLMKNGNGIMFSTFPNHSIIDEATHCDTKDKILKFLENIQTKVSKSDLEQRYYISHYNNDEYKDHAGGKTGVSHECPIDKMVAFVQLMISKEKKK